MKVDHPQNNKDLNQGFCISGPNLVILAWMSDALSCGQARDWYTHTRTHRPTDAADDNTRRPKLASGKNEEYLFHPRNHDIMKTNWVGRQILLSCHLNYVPQISARGYRTHIAEVLLQHNTKWKEFNFCCSSLPLIHQCKTPQIQYRVPFKQISLISTRSWI